MHVIGSLTIAGTAYPFDEELVDNTPVSFTNAGVTYHVEQLTNPGGAIGLWIDSNGSPTQAFNAQLSAVVPGLLDTAVIGDRSSNVSLGSLADILQDGTVKIASALGLSAPWTPSSYSYVSPFPSTSFGLGVNGYVLASGLLLGFVPTWHLAPFWHIVHQSPITMIFQ